MYPMLARTYNTEERMEIAINTWADLIKDLTDEEIASGCLWVKNAGGQYPPSGPLFKSKCRDLLDISAAFISSIVDNIKDMSPLVAETRKRVNKVFPYRETNKYDLQRAFSSVYEQVTLEYMSGELKLDDVSKKLSKNTKKVLTCNHGDYIMHIHDQKQEAKMIGILKNTELKINYHIYDIKNLSLMEDVLIFDADIGRIAAYKDKDHQARIYVYNNDDKDFRYECQIEYQHVFACSTIYESLQQHYQNQLTNQNKEKVYEYLPNKKSSQYN
jgi:hypothetical protein